MKIEHVAFQVEDPAAMADWYVAQFGFTVKRAVDAPFPVRFLADSSGQVMLELYNNPKLPVPAYGSMDPLLLHVAFVCEDVSGTINRLVESGAGLVGGPDTTSAGDVLAMLRDPWGLAIQLCQRAEPML